MTHKFKIGDIVAYKYDPEDQSKIVDIIENSGKWVRGSWNGGGKEILVPKNSYLLKDLENNKLTWGSVLYIHKNCQLFQQDKNEPLKWKNYEEILV